MITFDWNDWNFIYRKASLHSRKPLERMGLRFLHSPCSLERIAVELQDQLNASGIFTRVHAESIWTDGTPQAVFTTVAGEQFKCELADLLVIIKEVFPSRGKRPVRETGLLVQAKISKSRFHLSQGNKNGEDSTFKERNLLEKLDRTTPLVLLSGYSSKSTQIGSYFLAGAKPGLKDCARYLLMPDSSTWKLRTPHLNEPFQMGWASTMNPGRLNKPRNFTTAIYNMIVHKNAGKEISNPLKCEWSSLVEDLRRKYHGIQMRGYNKQNRINYSFNEIYQLYQPFYTFRGNSFSVSSSYLDNELIDLMTREVGSESEEYNDDEPPINIFFDFKEEDNLPKIPVMQLTLYHKESPIEFSI